MPPRASTSNRVVANTSKNAKPARSARDSSTSTKGGKKVAVEEEEEEFEVEEEEEDGVTETQAEMAAVLKAFKSASPGLSCWENSSSDSTKRWTRRQVLTSRPRPRRLTIC